MEAPAVIVERNQEIMNEEASCSPKLVRELMTVGVPTCSFDANVAELARTMLAKQWEAVIVLDDRGHAAGAITWDELVKAYSRGKHQAESVESIMRPDVPQVPPDIPLTAAAQIMQDLGTRALFMMHHAGGIEYPAAVLTYQHLLRHLAAQEGDDLRDLGIHAVRQSPVELFRERRDAARRKAGLDG